MKRTSLYTLIICPLLVNCSLMQNRYQNNNDSNDINEYESYLQQRQSHKAQQAALELGYSFPNKSVKAQYKIQNRMKVKELEKRLNTKKEKEQYFRYNTLFKSDQERIKFLSIPSHKQREHWAKSKNLANREKNFDELTKNLISENDIALGMNQFSVKESWGEPELIDIAGNPLYKNERWKYTKYVGTKDGYQVENRYIYFEAGRVIGWEKKPLLN